MSAKFAITGRVVTMDAASTVIDRGTVYVDEHGVIAAVVDMAQQPQPQPPAGFEAVNALEPGVTIYPGLIELHNHLSYDALPLWKVPQQFGDRSQWQGAAAYQQLVSHPMTTIGGNPQLVPSVVRYVESKCLLGGVTTSQGVSLSSSPTVRTYYQGSIRVVESPRDASLPAAATHIPDVAAKDRDSFLAEQQKHQCMLLHLSEGTDAAARSHFTDLQAPDGSWAIAPSLAGIHCVALTDADFAVMAAHGASMVWSPLSNLLLYGGTADIAAARKEGVRIGIGSDWSPSGSKNLFGELKVACAYAESHGLPFTPRDLLAMATRDAAAILHWDSAVGCIEAGKTADLLLLDGTNGDPYTSFLQAAETAIVLVMVGGTAHFGRPALMAALGAAGETVSVGGDARTLSFVAADEPSPMSGLTYAAARDMLRAALNNPPSYTAPPALAATAAAAAGAPARPEWRLDLDELGGTGMALRPLIGAGASMAPEALDLTAVAPLPAVAIALDQPTAADDPHWFDNLTAEANLPNGLAAAVQALY